MGAREKSMEAKISGKPGRAVSWGFIVILSLFLVFGIVFLASIWKELDSDSAVPVVSFFILFLSIILIMIIYYATNLIKKKGLITAEVQIETKNGLDTLASQNDPFDRLRGLEKLRKDGLITQEEYQVKRQEIMDQKW